MEACIRITKIAYGNYGTTLPPRLLDKPNTVYSDMLVVFKDGEVIGFINRKVHSKKDIDPKILECLENEDFKGNTYIYLNSISILPTYRNQGIATLLAEKMIKKIEEEYADSIIYADIVKPPNKPSVSTEGILKRLGFNRLTIIEDRWTEKLKLNGLSCNECGEECHCASVLMAKK